LPEVAVHIGSLVLVIWLIIGAIAAGQRHDYGTPPANCNSAATIAVTIVAGPLNYLGVNPKISCHVPQPSK
jgi:carbon starvation protein CstA